MSFYFTRNDITGECEKPGLPRERQVAYAQRRVMADGGEAWNVVLVHMDQEVAIACDDEQSALAVLVRIEETAPAGRPRFVVWN
jgi:hypothetical protein